MAEAAEKMQKLKDIQQMLSKDEIGKMLNTQNPVASARNMIAKNTKELAEFMIAKVDI